MQRFIITIFNTQYIMETRLAKLYRFEAREFENDIEMYSLALVFKLQLWTEIPLYIRFPSSKDGNTLNVPVIITPRWNHLIDYPRCRFSSGEHYNCCLSIVFRTYWLLYEKYLTVDGVPKSYHENCVVIFSAGILLSYIVQNIYQNVTEVRT